MDTPAVITPIKRAYLYPTLECNLACAECYTRIHSSEVADRCQLVASLLEMGVREFDLSGGEPLLYTGIVDLCRRIREVGDTRISLVTNGTLIAEKPDIVENLLTTLDEIAVSLASGCRNVDDSIRGHGAFDATLKGLAILGSRCSSQGLTLNTILRSELTVDNFLTVLDIAESSGASCVHLMELKWRQNWTTAYLSFLEKLLQGMCKRVKGKLAIKLDIPAVFYNIIAGRWQRECAVCGIRLQALCLRGCQAFNGEIVVLPSGHFTGCVDMFHTSRFHGGMISESKLSDIMEEIMEFRETIVTRKRLLRNGPCRECLVRGLCVGGCPVNTGNLKAWMKTPDKRCAATKEILSCLC